MGHGNNRFPLGTSFRPLRSTRVCRLADEITAATLFSGLEFKSVPRTGAFYRGRGPLRQGVCSSFLAERADDVPVPVFPSVAKHFHLPEDPDTPIIMIGPGTGV